MVVFLVELPDNETTFPHVSGNGELCIAVVVLRVGEQPNAFSFRLVTSMMHAPVIGASVHEFLMSIGWLHGN